MKKTTLCLLPDFKELFLKYYEPLCAYAYRYVREKATAEDLVQEVFGKLWENRNTIDRATSVKPWLYAATRHQAIDYLRNSRQREVMLDDSPAGRSLDDLVDRLIVSEQEEAFDFRLLTECVEACVERLPEQCRKVYRLSRQTDRTNKEIADSLGISVKAVEKHITRALTEIRKHVQAGGFLTLLCFFLRNG